MWKSAVSIYELNNNCILTKFSNKIYSDIGYFWIVALGSCDMNLSCHADAQIKVHIPH